MLLAIAAAASRLLREGAASVLQAAACSYMLSPLPRLLCVGFRPAGCSRCRG